MNEYTKFVKNLQSRKQKKKVFCSEMFATLDFPQQHENTHHTFLGFNLLR